MKPACCDILEACVNIGIAYSNSSEFLLLDDGIQLTRDQYQWPNFDPGQCMFARDYANRFSLCGLTALGASECDSSQTTFADLPHGVIHAYISCAHQAVGQTCHFRRK